MNTTASAPTEAEAALLAEIEGGGVFVHGARVRVARRLAERGIVTLEDNGPLRDSRGRSDRERWWVQPAAHSRTAVRP